MSKIQQNHGHVISSKENILTKGCFGQHRPGCYGVREKTGRKGSCQEEARAEQGQRRQRRHTAASRSPWGTTKEQEAPKANNYYKYHVTNSHGCPHTYNMITYTPNVSYAIHIHIIHKHTYIVIKLILYIIYFYVITSYTFYQTSLKARCMKCRCSNLKLVSNIL